jgi:hypothetical protein
MEELDTLPEMESAHHLDYEDMIEHVVGEEHELLYMDTWLREAFAGIDKEAVSL